MNTQEELNDTSFDEETKEEESDSKLDNEVNINNLETLQLTYHEIFSNSSILSKAYQNLRKEFKSLSKDHKQLQGNT